MWLCHGGLKRRLWMYRGGCSTSSGKRKRRGVTINVFALALLARREGAREQSDGDQRLDEMGPISDCSVTVVTHYFLISITLG